MLLYLDLAYNQARQDGRLRNLAELQEAIRHGAVKRVRPKFMTVACMFLGLVLIMWSASRCRCDEAYRRADDRQHSDVFPAGAGGVSGDL